MDVIYVDVNFYKFKESVEVLLNPKSIRRHLRQWEGCGRFLVDGKSKMVYLWDASKSCHKPIWEGVRKDDREWDDITILRGELTLVGTKMDVVHNLIRGKDRRCNNFDWLPWKLT